MPEEAAAVEAPQTQAPDSSTGSETPALEIPRNAEDYAKWRMTGEMPGQKSKKEASTPSDSEKTDAAPEAEKPAAEKPQRQAGADERLREILADLKQAGLTPKELKTFKRQAEAQQERTPEPRPETREAAPPPPPKGLEAPKKPKYDEFKDWEQYEAAKDKYNDDMTAYTVQRAIAQDRAERAQLESQRTWQAKLAEASQRYGAEAEASIVDTARTISADQNIHPAVKAVMDDSSVLTDLLYVIGSNSEAMKELIQLGRTNPGQAIRKVVLLEQLVKDELKNGQAKTAAPERGEDGKFLSASPAKKISQAPPPPREVSGRSGPPPDEIERAVEKHEFSNYKEVMNTRDIRKMKGL